MKILILSRYSRMGASSRLRTLQYIPLWESAGIQCDSHSLLNDQYLTEMYSGKHISKRNLLRCYLSMSLCLTKVRKYDLIVIEKEIYPYLPPIGIWVLSLMKVPFIVDYDDAIFHNYDLHPLRPVRWLMGRKIANIMRRASSVVCGNEYLAEYARKAGAKRVVIIPTVIDIRRYQEAGYRQGGPLVIGWIGSPFTLKYVRALRPVLQDLCSRYDARLRLIGAGSGIGLDDMEQVISWSEDTEVRDICGFDIGIMPLEESLWERGKCGYKLIQYMGCGLPVVGSPVGINNEIIQEGVNGFKPGDAAGWSKALENLLTDETLRREMGRRGRSIAEERFTLDRGRQQWLDEFSYVLNKQSDRPCVAFSEQSISP